jgi:predicted acetyltransferase
MDVAVTEAQADHRETLAQLLELNAYEFSQMDGRAVGPDGRFGYRLLDLYLAEAQRTPYLIRVDDELAGFALVRSEDGLLQIAEFLILPKFRRAGVGTLAARQVFDRHRGDWSVDQIPANMSATSFWRQAIPVPFEESIDENGRVVQRFTT